MRRHHSTVNPHDIYRCSGCGMWLTDLDRHNTDGEPDTEPGDWCDQCCPTCKENR